MNGKPEKRLWLDMDFSEALERFAQTDPDELPENVKLRRSKKAAGTKKAPAGKSGPKTKGRKSR